MHPLCLLARAIIEFNKNNIKESLKYLKRIVNNNARSPSDIWFAIGLCYYRLGNFPKSKITLDKVIEIDPQNSMALVSQSIIEITTNINDFENREKAMNLLEKSYNANPRNPLTLRYLADHYFFKNDLQISEMLC